MNLQPTLQGKLLSLRPLKADDFEALYAVASDPLIWEQHPLPTRYQRPVFEKLFASFMKSNGTFLVTENGTNEIIGTSQYYDFKPQENSVSIGYTMLARKYWGGRYNQELKSMMLNYAFNFVDTVYFQVGSQNFRSQKALQKIGAKACGESMLTLEDDREYHFIHFKISKPSNAPYLG